MTQSLDVEWREAWVTLLDSAQLCYSDKQTSTIIAMPVYCIMTPGHKEEIIKHYSNYEGKWKAVEVLGHRYFIWDPRSSNKATKYRGFLAGSRKNEYKDT